MIVMHGGRPSEVSELRQVFRKLAEQPGLRVAIHELPFIESVDPCALVAVSSSFDAGVAEAAQSTAFEWRMMPSSWDNVEGLLEPFSESGYRGAGFQFLNRGPGPEVIYSARSSW